MAGWQETKNQSRNDSAGKLGLPACPRRFSFAAGRE